VPVGEVRRPDDVVDKNAGELERQAGRPPHVQRRRTVGGRLRQRPFAVELAQPERPRLLRRLRTIRQR